METAKKEQMKEPTVISTLVGIILFPTGIISIASSYKYGTQGFLLTIGVGLAACLLLLLGKVYVDKRKRR